MSYIFRLHTGATIDAPGDGWLNSTPIDANAINTIKDDLDKMEDSGKVGTSIPTPFARIYLFQTAFDMVNRGAKGVYAELVSDCLDLLQFLFENGGSNDFKFEEWDKEARIKKLTQSSANAQMQLLGEAFNSAYTANTALPNKFVLIKYKGVLLGGTSPFTLVFTSPNLRRILKTNSTLSFTSSKNVEFCGSPRSLSERPIEFQEYLLGLMHKYRGAIHATSPMVSFRDYVYAQVIKDDDAIAQLSTQFDNYNKPYSLLRVNGIDICYNVKAPEMKDSDFLMKLSGNAPCFKNNYVPTTPLFLRSKFDESNWIYIDDEWNKDTSIHGSLERDTPVKERYLPKNGSGAGEKMPQKYPWLTDSDFLYDEIICTSYKLNTDKFYNVVTKGNNRVDAHFLLPIRKEYFLYFTFKDLKDNLRINIADGEADKPRKIEVELDIPLVSTKHNKITIRRTYCNEETAEYKIKRFEKTFGLGIFPFYQLSDPNLKDQYNVYLFNQDGHDALKFYSSKQTDCDGFEEVKASSTIRTKENGVGQSRVYTLRSESVSKSFDYIEASIKDETGEHKGLIIPIWPEVNTNNENRKAIFSIDFGTSNTHIAYLDPNSKEEAKVLPFSIDQDCQQMVLLNAPKEKDKKLYWRDSEEFKGIVAMPQFLREFTPSVIGDQDYDNSIKYPIRTATLQTADLNNCSNREAYTGDGTIETEKNRLFEAINIGFNIDSETKKFDERLYTYETNLKWALQEKRVDKSARLRVEAFCEQTLWMLKNLLVLKGMYSKDIQIIYFYPESMLHDDKIMFEEAWKKSIANVFTCCGFEVQALHQELESVAPYYSLMNQDGKLFAYNSVNIDIGGGTTDIFFFDKDYQNEETGEVYFGYETSVQFAANALWGRTYPYVSNSINGFVEHQKSTSSEWDDALKVKYDNFSQKNNEDLASFFFKYDGFKFKEHIQNNPKLRFVLFLHYASIIFYLSDMIKQIRKDRPELKMPSRLTFTGKGSEYIKIISSDENKISDLTWELFGAFGLEKEPFEVRYPRNPKALTAEGGVFKLATKDQSIKVDFVQESASSRRGLTSSSNRKLSRYRNISKDLLGFTPEEGKTYKISQVREYEGLVMAHIEKFLDAILKNNKICEILKGLSITGYNTERENILECTKESFNTWGEKYKQEHDSSETLDGTIFFLAWKNALIDLSAKYYNDTKNK